MQPVSEKQVKVFWHGSEKEESDCHGKKKLRCQPSLFYMGTVQEASLYYLKI